MFRRVRSFILRPPTTQPLTRAADTLFITDIYDYAHQDLPYVSLQDMAIDTMARAQDAGVIVPYHVVVTRSIGK